MGAVALMLSACKKDKDGGAIGVLDPVQIQRALVIENTGMWCGTCSVGAERIAETSHTYDIALPVAVHYNDALANSTSLAFKANFPTSSYPNFYVNNQNASQFPAGYVASIEGQMPMAGVGHEREDAGTKINVKARVKFYNNDAGNYRIGVYFINGDVPAKDQYVQSDFASTNNLEEIDNTSYWKRDAAQVASGFLIKKGDVYLHTESIMASADGLDTWGEQLPVSSVSAGDVYTLNFTLTKPQVIYPGYKVLTVIWKMEDTKAMFINGYMK